MMLSPHEQSMLEEMKRLLAEATENSLKHDGHCKSSEGAISIQMNIPPFFWREDAAPVSTTVSVYSYLLGPGRQHYFDSLEQALVEVRQWHKDEMEHDYSHDWGW